MSSLEDKIRQSRSVRKLRIWLSRIVLPGFQGVSLYDSLYFFTKEIFSNRFSVLAQAVSFSFLMALPSFLLFLFTLIPYLPFSDVNLIRTIEQTIGLITQSEEFQASVSTLINDFFLHKKEVLLSFSVLMTLFFSSNGMIGLMNGFDRGHIGFIKQSWYIKRAWALGLTVVFILVLLISFGLIIFQLWAFNYFEISEWTFVAKIVEFIIISAMLTFSISLIYKYGPAIQNRWPFFTPGSIAASLLIIVITAGFFYMVNNLVNYNQIYGSVGTLIVFLIWLFTISQILLIGFELNVSIFVNKEMLLKQDAS